MAALPPAKRRGDIGGAALPNYTAQRGDTWPTTAMRGAALCSGVHEMLARRSAASQRSQAWREAA